MLESGLSANCGSVHVVNLIGNKVFTYGSDTMEPGYSLISKVQTGGTGEVTFTDGTLQIYRNAGSTYGPYYVYGFIPFIKQAGMQTIKFTWQYTSVSNAGTVYIKIGIMDNDLTDDTTFISTVYYNSTSSSIAKTTLGTSIASLTDGNLYYIKFCMKNSGGYTHYLNIYDIWFE